MGSAAEAASEAQLELVEALLDRTRSALELQANTLRAVKSVMPDPVDWWAKLFGEEDAQAQSGEVFAAVGGGLDDSPGAAGAGRGRYPASDFLVFRRGG